jgi:SPP1 gp7 family putative phage head morphogenesis protein
MPDGYTFDKVGKSETRRERETFARVRNAERQYSVRLRQVARHIGDLVKAFNAGDIGQLDTLTRLLERYADLLRPWAKSVAAQMLADVSRRDENAWAQYARSMGIELKRELATATSSVGLELARLLNDQVELITSLPLQAAQRVQKIAIGQLYSGHRTDVLIEEILQTGSVVRARAELIARTETSRAATGLTMIRAKHVGSEGYVWRTSRDIFVRPRHKKLDGTFHKWDDPPVSGENGEKSHPGGIYNCRCYPEVVLPKTF